MRDPNRIQELLSLLEEIWIKSPDLRFNQLVYNLQHNYSKISNDYGLVEEVKTGDLSKIGFDFFNLKDDRFIEYLRTLVINN